MPNNHSMVLIYPNQLFEDISQLDKNSKVILVEDFLYFKKYKFHKQKILLHRASMKSYEKYLQENSFETQYVDSVDLENRKSLGIFLEKTLNKSKKIITYEIVDEWQKKDLEKVAKDFKLEIEYLRNDMFINSSTENKDFFTKPDGTQKKPFMKTFYEWQRQRLGILMNAVTDAKSGKEKLVPIGGKYSFDEDNRKKLPKDYTELEGLNFRDKYKDDEIFIEAKKYVEENFADNYGSIGEDGENFNYGINSKGAKKVLKNFLENKLKDFGVYEDSISKNLNFVNHSILTPYLNTGLLTPKYVIDETLKFAKLKEKTENEIPLNSQEGFIRQIIGWREFMRAMYELHGSSMRTKNFFKNIKKLENFWWTGETENKLIGDTVKKVIANAYNHHIERLMILGNYMLLSEYEPDEVYTWFMTMYIDAYDWVMVPNVYDMSQFASGGVFATKPYISAANYILKMSDYKRDDVWDVEFDKKFWDFLKKHRTYFGKNIRFKMLLSRLK